jgi:hypothetical protein
MSVTNNSAPSYIHTGRTYDPRGRSYMVGEAVEVYSRTAERWERGTVVTLDSATQLTVKYGANSGGPNL